MASALVSQLAGIRSVNAARLATLGSSAGAVHTASYLFPPKTAAAQDLDTLHALARTGLDELAAQDAWFDSSEWATAHNGKDLLFGHASKSRDRSLLTKDDNARIDASLALFLARVAHDITGRSAAKCIEWLVRRFRIHEFNVPVLLAAFLPFHTTPQFARILKICKIERHPYLAFLQPCQKQEVPLPAPLLVSALLAPPNLSTSNELLRWITSLILVPKAAGGTPHRSLVSFWAATLIQFSLRWADLGQQGGGASFGSASHSRKGKRRRLENRLDDAQLILNLILPITVRCAALAPSVSTRDSDDDQQTGLRTAALMVIAALGACFPLSADAVRATIGSLVGPAQHHAHHADNGQVIMPLLTACIALFTYPLSDDAYISPLLEASAGVSTAPPLLSAEAAQTLLTLPAFVDNVVEASGRGVEVRPFVAELLAALTRPSSGKAGLSSEAAAEAMSRILLSSAVEDDFRRETTQYLLTRRYANDEASLPLHHLRLRLLGDVREQSPDVFDEAVKRVNGSLGEDKEAEEALWAVLKAVITKNVVPGGRLANGKEDEDATTALWLTIHSPSPTQRVLAVKSLYQALAEGTLPPTDSFVLNALEARLSAVSEEDADVLQAVYAEPGRVLAVLGPARATEVVLGALDPEAQDGQLARSAVEAHLRFFLAHLLPSEADSDAEAAATAAAAAAARLAGRLVRDVLWGRLVQTKATRKTVDAVADALRTHARLPPRRTVAVGGEGGVADQVWSNVLRAIVASMSTLGTVRDDAQQYNETVARAIAGEVGMITDEKVLDEVVEFLIAKIEAASSSSSTSPGSNPSPTATQASARALSFYVLARLIGDLKGSTATRVARRIAFSLRLAPPADASSAEEHVDDLARAPERAVVGPGLGEAVYSKPGNERTLRRLGAFMLGTVIQSLSFADETAEGAALLPIGSYAIPSIEVEIRVYAFLVSGHFGPQTSKALKEALWARLGESSLAFLATVWTASPAKLAALVRGVRADRTERQMDVVLRTAALGDARDRVASALISEDAGTGTTRIQDFQTLVPALLLALQDEDKDVRQAALGPLERLASAREVAARDGVEFVEYGYDAIYGASSTDLVYLHYADVCKYVHSLLEERESFVNDERNLGVWHGTALRVVKADKRKEAEYKQAVVAFILAHIVAWPSTLAGIGLLESLRDVASPAKLRSLMPVLRRVVAGSHDDLASDDGEAEGEEQRQRLVRLLFKVYDGSAAATVEDASNGSWAFLLESLSSSSVLVQSCACDAASGPLFKALRPDLAQKLLQHLANLLYEAPIAQAQQIRQCLKDVPAPPEMFAPVLAQLRTKLGGNIESEGPQAKRQRTSMSVAPEEVQACASSTLAVLLDTVGAREIKGVAVLVAELFEVLRTAVELSGTASVNADHLMQLAMAALLQALPPALKAAQVTQAIRVDTIIGAIKVSQNPQTFQRALTLLNRIATINQELVLHNVMPIFTFVGSSMLQRDDAYGFEIVQQTLRSIIPAYVQTLRTAAQQGQGGSYFDLLLRGRTFMRIFTDAATHIPRHRRQTFFKSLLDVLGPADFLGAICMLLTDRSSHKVVKQSSEAFAESIALPLSLLASFGVDKQVGAIEQVYAEVVRLWEHRALSTMEARDFVFLDRMDRAMREHSDRRAGPTHQLCALLRLVIAATTSSSFRSKLVKVKRAETRAVMDGQLEGCVHKTLKLALVEEEEVRAVAMEVLEALLQHISAQGFMRLVGVLVTDASEATRRTGLSLFATRFALMSIDEKLVAEAKVQPVLDVAVKAIAGVTPAGPLPDELSEALASVKVATAAKLTTLHPTLVAAVPELLKLGSSTALDASVRVEVLTAISRIVRVVGPRLLPQLANIVTFALAVVKQGASEGSGKVLSAAFGVLSSLVVTLPTFVVSHVHTILSALVDESLLDALQEPACEGAQRPLNTLYDALVTSVAVEKILDSLTKLWTTHSQGGEASSLVSVVECLRRVILNLDRPGVAAVYKSLFRFFLKIFDSRRLLAGKVDEDGINSIEEVAVQAFIDMSLQLNESAFRPLFYHVFDWAVLELAEDERPVSDHGLRARRTLLFKMVNTLLRQLKSLFTTYYATVLDHTIELLNHFTEGELEDGALWNEVLTSVALTCQFDEGNFWNPTRLSKISASLIGQVQVCAGASNETEADLLASAVAALAQTVSDEDSVQSLNDALLRKTRAATSSAVRATALHVLDELWRTQGEAMQPFVPQTTPFLAELLDADDADVLEGTNRLVQTIEGILGEPLDSYLQ